MKDIDSIEDIQTFVNGFYDKVKNDELLAPVFAIRIEANGWDVHLERMYDFWNTVLFFDGTYKGNPFSKHIGLPITENHFSRWIVLFHQTIDSHFSGERAEEVKLRASKMGMMFSSKMNYYRDNDSKPIM